MKNHYETLGIGQEANSIEIKEAAQVRANEIKVIYEVLIDADKRKAYDAELASSTQNYYEVLAISQSASNAEIKEAAQASMDKMKVAFSVLYDPNERKVYDQELTSSANCTVDDVGIIELQQEVTDDVANPIQHFQSEVSPYQPPAIKMVDVDEGNFELAGRGTRFGANMIDQFLAFLPLFILITMLEKDTNAMVNADDFITFGVFGIFFFLWILGLSVVNMVLLYQNGQTIGKRMLAIKVVRIDGSRVSLLRIIFLRFLPIVIISMVPIFSLVSIIDVLLIFQNSKRCLHDLIAETIVINVSKKISTSYQTSISA